MSILNPDFSHRLAGGVNEDDVHSALIDSIGLMTARHSLPSVQGVRRICRCYKYSQCLRRGYARG
jgi:hypothetical protein